MKRIYIIMAILVALSGLIGIETLNNGSTFGVIRGQINDNFTEVANTDTLQTARIDTVFADVDTLKLKTETVTLFANLYNHEQELSDTSYAWIDGSFSNSNNNLFETVADSVGGNYIKYIGTQTVTIAIFGSMNFETAFASDVYFALKIGDPLVLYPQSVIIRTIKANEDIVTMSGSCMYSLEPNDKIQIVMKTTNAGGNTISGLNMSVLLMRAD